MRLSTRTLAIALGACAGALSMWPNRFSPARLERFVRKTVNGQLGKGAIVQPALTSSLLIERLRPGEWGWVSYSDLLVDLRGRSVAKSPHFLSTATVVRVRPSNLRTVLVYRKHDGNHELHSFVFGPVYGVQRRKPASNSHLLPITYSGQGTLPEWARA